MHVNSPKHAKAAAQVGLGEMLADNQSANNSSNSTATINTQRESRRPVARTGSVANECALRPAAASKRTARATRTTS